MRTLSLVVLTLALAASAAAQAQSAVTRAQGIAQGARSYSRGAKRIFEGVLGHGYRPQLGKAEESGTDSVHTTTFGKGTPNESRVTTTEATHGGHAFTQVLSSTTSAGPRGTSTTSVKSATLNGPHFSEYSVLDSGNGGAEPMRSGTWKSQSKRLGGLFSVRTKTETVSFYDGKGALKSTDVLKNRKTLHLGPVPVMYLGRNMTKADIANVVAP